MTIKQTAHVLIALLIVSVVTGIVVVVLHSTRPPDTVSLGSDQGVDQPVSALVAPTTGAVRPVITARGSATGYDCSVRIVPVDDRTSTLDVSLTTEATPASAPTAQGELSNAAGARRVITLTVTGPGQWSSDPVVIAPGKYTLTVRFDRSTGPITIPIRLTMP